MNISQFEPSPQQTFPTRHKVAAGTMVTSASAAARAADTPATAV
jgi:hypothetical protein